MENLNIPKDKFQFANKEEHLHDKKFETKQVGYLHDAFNRFCRNKASIFGAVIVLILVLLFLYRWFVPIAIPLIHKTVPIYNISDFCPRRRPLNGRGGMAVKPVK